MNPNLHILWHTMDVPKSEKSNLLIQQFLTQLFCFQQLILRSEMRYFSKGSFIADSREEAKMLMVITSGQVANKAPWKFHPALVYKLKARITVCLLQSCSIAFIIISLQQLCLFLVLFFCSVDLFPDAPYHAHYSFLS